VAAAALHLELGGDVEGVVPRVLPVDVAQGETLGLAVDVLVEALAEGQQVVDFLAGADQSLEGDVAQRLDRLGDVLLR
jgi:hypothetical protein